MGWERLTLQEEARTSNGGHTGLPGLTHLGLWNFLSNSPKLVTRAYMDLCLWPIVQRVGSSHQCMYPKV